jgi:thiol-disulfide isomerase/thioredoxin
MNRSFMNSRRLTVLVVSLAFIASASVMGYRIGQQLSAAEGSMAGAALRPLVSDWLAIPVPEDVEFEGLDDEPVRLADYRGQIVLLNFWGTWCPPCVREIPELARLQPRLLEIHGTVLGPAIDSGSAEDILEFTARYGVNYPIVKSNTNQAVGTFAAAGYPFTLLIDRDGVIRKTYLGPQTMQILWSDIRRLDEEG